MKRAGGGRWLWFLVAAVVAGSVSTAQAQRATDWKAGVAKVAITPAGPIWMAGYGARNKPSEGVRQDLYAKALALQDETGKNTVLVTLDLVGIKRELSDQIAERCRKQFGLPRDRLALNSSHTHSGPVTGRPPPYADVSKEQEEVIRRYTENCSIRWSMLSGDPSGISRRPRFPSSRAWLRLP